MKVAVVSPYGVDRFGGVQGQAIQLVEWLSDAGHKAWLVAPGTGGPSGTKHVGNSVTLRANKSRAPLALDPRAIRRSVAAVEGADVVHVHEPLMPMVSVAVLVGKTPPTVGTFHADPTPMVRRLYAGGRPLLRRLVQRLAVATAVSPVAQSAVAELVDTRIVPNGIDVDSFAVDVERHSNRVVFVGRDDPRKGLDVILKAWHKVRAAVPDAELIVTADRDDDSEGVEFRGRVTDTEKRALLASSVIACCPNLSGESFGLVVAEGMAAGCAVVASKIPAFEAVLGDAGVLIAPGDTHGLAEAIIDLLQGPSRARELTARGTAKVREFDREAVLAGYLTAYEDALVASK